MDERILNVGLDLAMEFGKNWLQPIQTRLAKKFPTLSPAQLDEYERACREAMKFGHAQVPIQWRRAGGQEKSARRLFDEVVLAAHPWITRTNLSHLFSQGCYYAWKDGDLAV
jgi:hypothetical protein